MKRIIKNKEKCRFILIYYFFYEMRIYLCNSEEENLT